MKKAQIIAGVGGVFCLLLFLAVRGSGPRHQGRSAAGWVEQLGSTNAVTQWEATAAVRALGTSALPVLVEKLQAEESTLRSNVTTVLRKQDLVPIPRPGSTARRDRQDAVRGFEAMGAEPAAVGALVPLLDDPRTADHASYALIQLDDRVIPALLVAVTNAGIEVRRRVIADLGHRHTRAPGVETALVERLVHDPDPVTRSMAGISLGLIPDLSPATIQALIAALDDPVTFNSAAQALAEAGTNARPAIPALEQHLRGLKFGAGGSMQARQALSRIDPSVLTRLGIVYVPATNRYE